MFVVNYGFFHNCVIIHILMLKNKFVDLNTIKFVSMLAAEQGL
jgi:hypothetical protein